PLISWEPSPPRPKPQPRPELQQTQAPSAQPVHLQPRAQLLHADPANTASVSATREEIEALVAKLRAGRGGDRKQVLDRLVQLGESARPELERALADATFETDVLNEALARVRGEAGAGV